MQANQQSTVDGVEVSELDKVPTLLKALREHSLILIQRIGMSNIILKREGDYTHFIEVTETNIYRYYRVPFGVLLFALEVSSPDDVIFEALDIFIAVIDVYQEGPKYISATEHMITNNNAFVQEKLGRDHSTIIWSKLEA